MMNGIDISNYNRGLDLDAVPCDFVICKATEGTSIVHNTCDPWIQKAISLGKKWGFYHFLNTEDVIAQADYFVKSCSNYFGKGIAVLDYEMYGKVHGAAGAWKFIQRVHDLTGIWCMIYSNRATFTEDDFTEIAKHCALWVAQYANNAQTGYQSAPWCPAGGFGAWDSATIFQYSSNGRLSGYNGPLDLDLAYLDASGWDRIATSGSADQGTQSHQQVADNTPAESVLELVAQVQEGKIGTGDERKRYLGTKYQSVQDTINYIYKSSTSELADAVERGQLGNGDLRKRILGSRYNDVQALINQRAGVSSKRTYKIQSGDTLSAIALRYHTTVAKLVSANKIANANRIYPGQVIVIP